MYLNASVNTNVARADGAMAKGNCPGSQKLVVGAPIETKNFLVCIRPSEIAWKQQKKNSSAQWTVMVMIRNNFIRNK